MTDDNDFLYNDENVPGPFNFKQPELDDSLGVEMNPLTAAFMREVAAKVGLNHLRHVDELAAAFMARHRIDPDEAEVETQMEQGDNGPIWRTRIVRRGHGSKT
jgi:hypothetical protein